jgi:hypothetical protein
MTLTISKQLKKLRMSTHIVGMMHIYDALKNVILFAKLHFLML